MYCILKTSLLGPKQYVQLLNGIAAIEDDAAVFIRQWAQTKSVALQEEALSLASFCKSSVQRAYLTLLLVKCFPELQVENVSQLVNACKSVLHPLKGLFLQHKLLSVLQDIPVEGKVGIFIDSYSFSLKLFGRWLQMGLRNERPMRVQEREELFELAFHPLLRSINHVSSAESFSTIVLPTMMSELINSTDSQTQSLVFNSLCSVTSSGIALTLSLIFVSSALEWN